ncbi:unnamed protein product [Lactuca virosa]|uniref:Protein kinase domain-containing protein n=1 Tax=Lactuca virosa TaxID=75947 RepID=A0AAU9LP31_9ASTR|nr:unnamed protein product [Lactuca virosa]
MIKSQVGIIILKSVASVDPMASDSSDIPSLKNVEVVAGKVNPPKDVSKSTVDPNDSNSSDIPSPENFEDVCGKVDPLSDVSQSTFDPNDSSSSDICSPKKFGDFDGKVNPHSDVSKSTCLSDSVSVEIIDFNVSLQSLQIPVGEGHFGRDFFNCQRRGEAVKKRKKEVGVYVGSGKKL